MKQYQEVTKYKKVFKEAISLDFSESELKELQELLDMVQDYIDTVDRNNIQDWKEKENNIKKFRKRFSKVKS